MFLETPTLQILRQALDAAMLRQKVIAQNIANAETPGYKSREVIFEEELKKQLEQAPSGFVGKRTHPLHLPIGGEEGGVPPRPRIVSTPGYWLQNNGNNVDIEYEMTKLAESQIYYQALAQLTNAYFSKMREVIREGR